MPVIISGSQGTTTISGSGVSGSLTVTGSLIVSGSNTITNYGAFTSNEAAGDFDFRVESSGEPNMLFVDGGENRVGIGTVSPSKKLHVSGSNALASILVASDAAAIELYPASGPALRFGTPASPYSHQIYGTYLGKHQIQLVSSLDFQISGGLGGVGYYFDQSSGSVGIGTATPNSTFQVSGSQAGNLLTVGDANATLDETHHIVQFTDATGGQKCILPAADTCGGRTYHIFNQTGGEEEGGTISVNVADSSGDTIDGNDEIELAASEGNMSISVVSNGSDRWMIFGQYNQQEEGG